MCVCTEPEPCADQDDQGGGQQGEGADPPGAQRHAGEVTGAGQSLDPCPHLRHQDLHHCQPIR